MRDPGSHSPPPGASGHGPDGAAAHEDMRRCLAAAGVGYWLRDHRSGSTFVDACSTGMLGFSPEEYGDPARAWVERVHAEDLFRLREAIGDAPPCDADGRYALEYRMRHRDGHWVWVLESGQVLERDADGRPARSAGVHIDITRRKLAEIDLQDAKDYAEQWISGANAIVIGLDLDGRVVVFNRAAERCTGYSFAELRGRRWFDLGLPRAAHPELCADIEHRYAAGRVPANWEYPILTRDGEERQIVWQNSLLLAKGELAGNLSFGFDVTERRRAEAALAASEARLRVAALQSEFLASVSHELRSPLHVIIGFLGLADERLDEVQGEARPIADWSRAKLGRAAVAAKRLLALVDDLLDLAKLEAGRMEMQREPNDLLRLLDGTLEDFEPLLLPRRIKLQRNYPPQPIQLLVDGYRIVQVFRNVLSNAAKYSPDGGTIDIGVLPARRDGVAGVEVSIEDAGQGIPDGEFESIFDKFVQSSSTKANKSGSSGTGLGLPIAREIMRAHDGDIWACNRAQGGARFVMFFPFAATAA